MEKEQRKQIVEKTLKATQQLEATIEKGSMYTPIAVQMDLYRLLETLDEIRALAEGEQ